MYTPANFVLAYENRWLHLFSFDTTCLERRATMAILCSLVNTVTSFDPIGYGIPYSAMLFSDTKEVLVTVTSQCLISLLDSSCGIDLDAPSPESIKGKEVERRKSSSSTGTSSHVGNKFQNYIARIHRPQDLEMILDSFTRLMSNPMETKTTYLPGSRFNVAVILTNSRKKSEVFVEVLMLFWKFLDYNEKFARTVYKDERALTIASSLIFFILGIFGLFLHFRSTNRSKQHWTRSNLHMSVFVFLIIQILYILLVKKEILPYN
jgi:hypothetical protein